MIVDFTPSDIYTILHHHMRSKYYCGRDNNTRNFIFHCRDLPDFASAVITSAAAADTNSKGTTRTVIFCPVEGLPWTAGPVVEVGGGFLAVAADGAASRPRHFGKPPRGQQLRCARVDQDSRGLHPSGGMWPRTLQPARRQDFFAATRGGFSLQGLFVSAVYLWFRQ